MLEQRLNYPRRVATLGICVHEAKYLLLRIDKHWKFCPGDWDFVIATFIDQFDSADRNSVKSAAMHTGLTGKVVRSYPVLEWPDHESKVLFALFPHLIHVPVKEIELSHKFCQQEWVDEDAILSFDRNEYLFAVLSHISCHGGIAPPGL